MIKEEDKNMMIIMICRFLKENNALEKFCYNYSVCHNIEVDKSIRPSELTRRLISDGITRALTAWGFDFAYDDPHNYKTSKYRLIIDDIMFNFIDSCHSAFYWVYTEENSDYWGNLSQKWHKYFKENRTKYNL